MLSPNVHKKNKKKKMSPKVNCVPVLVPVQYNMFQCIKIGHDLKKKKIYLDF